MRAVGVAAQRLPRCCPRCCPAAVAAGGVLRHVNSDADRSATTARMLPRGRRHDGGCWARERALRPAWPERVFLKQQSPTQRKGGEAPGGLEGAVAGLFFRPECCSSREGAAICAAARALEDTHRREQAGCRVSVVCVAELQGLPLLLFLTATKGCHLSNYSSVGAAATQHRSWRESPTGAAATPRRRAAGPWTSSGRRSATRRP